MRCLLLVSHNVLGSSASSVQGSNKDTAYVLREGRRARIEEDVGQQRPDLLQLLVLQREQCLADLTPEHGRHPGSQLGSVRCY